MMRLALVYLALVALCGCETRGAARQQAREAYLAGQNQAMAQQQALMMAQHPTVAVHGEVETPMVPWTPDLTLSRAIVAAHYTGLMNPSVIRVLRNGQLVHQFMGVDLLRGHDMPLQAGDVVEMSP